MARMKAMRNVLIIMRDRIKYPAIFFQRNIDTIGIDRIRMGQLWSLCLVLSILASTVILSY